MTNNVVENKWGLLKAREIAGLLAVDTKTIHNWANEGKIPVALRTGRTVRFRLCEVTESLSQATYALQQQKMKRWQADREAALAASASVSGVENLDLNN